MDMVQGFFAYAQEREAIRRKREAGEPRPWTEDAVLQRWRFCNVFREHDKTTVWFRERWRDRVRNDPRAAVWGCFLFRWFNLIESGERLLAAGLDRVEDWDADACRRAFEGADRFVTGAYMVKTPDGLKKLEGILSCVEQTVSLGTLDAIADRAGDLTLEAAHVILQEAPFMGSFMAYEVVTDLRHTCVLEDAPDIMTWASPGPGAARGLDWVHGPPKPWPKRQYHLPESRAQMIREMQDLLAESRNPQLWPQEFGRWEMREVEHTLCEFDKYMRAINGQTLKRRFDKPERRTDLTQETRARLSEGARRQWERRAKANRGET